MHYKVLHRIIYKREGRKEEKRKGEKQYVNLTVEEELMTHITKF